MSFELITIPCLSDNYAFILYNVENRSALLVDAPEAGPINQVLSKNNLNLEKIFLTHHHADHIDGLDEILEKHSAVTIGAKADTHRLPKLDEYVEAGDQFLFQGQVGEIFDVSGQCNEGDSADVLSEIIGGTPPYLTLWSNGDTSPNTYNLQPNSMLPYSIAITDNNGCEVTEFLSILPTPAMKTFSSFDGVICKDDKSAKARVFVSDGHPPYKFIWSNDYNTTYIDSSSSSIYNLIPGTYFVEIEDNNSCLTFDTITIKTEINNCLDPKKVFSPNNDGINDIWEIENISIYPNALVEIFSKNGHQVFRKRNYQNSINDAFSGIDMNGNILQSATYYYIISVEEINDVYKGTLTIVR